MIFHDLFAALSLIFLFCSVDTGVRDLHMKSSEVCIKTRSTPASLPIQGQVTKHKTVKWPIISLRIFNINY